MLVVSLTVMFFTSCSSDDDGDKDVQVIEDCKIPMYECDCSKEHMADGLATIGKEELKDIIEKEGEAELVCHFCNKKYHFSKEELEKIL